MVILERNMEMLECKIVIPESNTALRLQDIAFQ